MENILNIIQRPVVTERATQLRALANQYVFRVAPNASKRQIKLAVEQLFKVKVAGVNTMRVRGKHRRMGTAPAGTRNHWKKAIVTVQKGEEIKFVEETQ